MAASAVKGHHREENTSIPRAGGRRTSETQPLKEMVFLCEQIIRTLGAVMEEKQNVKNREVTDRKYMGV